MFLCLIPSLCFASAQVGEASTDPGKPRYSAARQTSGGPAGTVATDAPSVQVDYFGAENGFTAGGASIPVLCVVRNIGTAAIPENSVRLRCYTLSGLEYTSGEIWPIVPPLAPNQSATVRWRLTPTDVNGPLMVAVLTDRIQQLPAGAAVQTNSVSLGPNAPIPGNTRVTITLPNASRAVMTVIPRFNLAPRWVASGDVLSPSPQASVDGRTAWIGNDRTVIRVQKAQGELPVLALTARDLSQWKLLATITPILRVRSAEDGQMAWWETFRWRDSAAREDRDVATLSLSGSVGANWQAEIVLESRRGTGAVNGRLRLTARRTLRCFGVQLPRLLAETDDQGLVPKADGSMQILEADPSPISDSERVAARHIGDLTFGLAWSSNAPLNNWTATRSPIGDHLHKPVLGAQWDSTDRGDIIVAGATVEFTFRMFAFSPSNTVRDAQRFIPR